MEGLKGFIGERGPLGDKVRYAGRFLVTLFVEKNFLQLFLLINKVILISSQLY